MLLPAARSLMARSVEFLLFVGFCTGRLVWPGLIGKLCVARVRKKSVLFFFLMRSDAVLTHEGKAVR